MTNMEELPKISENQVLSLDDSIKQLLTGRDITKWLDAELTELANINPVLYKRVMDHSQRLAAGAMMSPDVQSVALSLCLDSILLLKLINEGLKGKKKLKEFEDGWGNMLKGIDLNLDNK